MSDLIAGARERRRRPRPLIHIGYHKTASTWLQRFLFRDAGCGFFWMDVEKNLFLSHPLRFDAARCRARYEALREAAPPGAVPVLSNERLSGHPHSGGYDCETIARRLRAVFPDGRVLIVIREQKAAILSAYKQYVKKGGMRSLVGYLRPQRDGHVPQFDPDHFAYDAIIELYQTLFGAENVCVLAYEDFASAPEAFLSRVASFAGVPPVAGLPVSRRANAQAPAVTVWLKARLNLFIRADTVNGSSPLASPLGAALFLPFVTIVGRLVPPALNRWLERRWREEIEAAFATYFAGSNRRTKELTGIDLERPDRTPERAADALRPPARDGSEAARGLGAGEGRASSVPASKNRLSGSSARIAGRGRIQT
ncbi:sulfotransferase [Amphiplicatus metriothermophilus]|uniref:Sulfotransferase family protein n=1 Tax=Amphiplicatus metriothermophilus TaxID=1519374 RepID=A0A239PY84_9PROT|nr:sulfotransferase [Amphiplicatus metriothermophilus]MBB5519747.1 hypothetical protein [Amphiplicatus metriothermophilus]SNT75269.1 Sulfotransferase family protein [Amphiplicatus metriothermophilus]